ncbi:MAG: nucleotidyltransferase domain-containing protein [Deltaproteobacteria bacterium]|nr:nucleotidyltransferase domain-containing protein [Deltaproteobacteria bacterium]
MGAAGREEQIIRESVAMLIREFHPRRIYLFGSRAKHTAAAGADFDLAVEAPPPSTVQKSRAMDMLAGIAGLYSVNLVFLPEVDKGFRKIVVETGKVLYEQDAQV